MGLTSKPVFEAFSDESPQLYVYRDYVYEYYRVNLLLMIEQYPVTSFDGDGTFSWY